MSRTRRSGRTRVALGVAASALLTATAAATAAPPNVVLGFAQPVPGTVADATGAGTGLTGVQPNSAGDAYQPAALRLGGGALAVTSSAGDALGAGGDQQNALQVEVDGSEAYQVAATLRGPLELSQPFQSAGIFVGPGQDDYVKLVAGIGPQGPRIQLFKETGGSGGAVANVAVPSLTSVARVDLTLEVDPEAGTVTGTYSLDGGPVATAGSTGFAGVGTTSDTAGLITTSTGAPPATVRFDAFLVESENGVAFSNPVVAHQLPDLPGPGEPQNGKQFPTSLALGPDGRLYVAAQYGRIHVLDLDGQNLVTGSTVIDAIHDVPNQDFDGTPGPEKGRQVTGIAFDPQSTASDQILYVSHSDPTIFEETEPGQSTVYPASGRVTRLVLDGAGTVTSMQDVVVGLPRSAENHSVNGMAWGPDGWLYLGVGGNTNAGGQSKPFGYFPEVPLSASVLRIDVRSIGATPVDVTGNSTFTFTDPCGPGESVGAGCSAAAVVTTAPPATPALQVYARGFRNPYDVLWHSNGKLYLNENEHNTGFGPTPGPATPNAGTCPGPAAEPGEPPDHLFLVQAGAYHGHPNPSLGECVLDGGVAPIGEYGARSSTTGLAEYTSGAFGGLLTGQLLATSYAIGKKVERIRLAPDGASVLEQADVATNLQSPIDVVAAPNGDILVAEHDVNPGFGSGRVLRIRPFLTGFTALGPAADSDGDGFSDQDEADNGTARTNPASRPDDADGDLVSDLNDPDDDGDGVADVDDRFQRDPRNGAGTTLPFTLAFDTPNAGGWFGTGFGGIQPSARGGPLAADANGRPLVGAGGAGGFLAMTTTAGTAEGGANDQRNALQHGFDARAPFAASVTVVNPFGGAPGGTHRAGVFFGPGEDDFVRLAVRAEGGGAVLELGREQGGRFERVTSAPLTVPAAKVVLTLEGQPGLGLVIARAQVGNGAPAEIGRTEVPAAWFAAGAPAGIMASGGASFVFDDFTLSRVATAPAPGGPGILAAAVCRPGGDATAPRLTGRTPAAGARAARSGPVSVAFSEPVVVPRDAVRLTDATGRERGSRARLDRSRRILTVVPTTPLPVAGVRLTISGAGSRDAVTDLACNPLAGATATFRVRGPVGGRVRLSAGQLLVNQRVSQAAIARERAVRGRLGALTGADLQAGTLGRRALASAVPVDGDESGLLTPSGPARTLRVPPLARRDPGRVTLTVRQLRINQRISQAAVRRTNALTASLERGLTGAELRDGTVGTASIAPGLTVGGAPGGTTAGGGLLTPAGGPPRSARARFTLSESQLRINQRISQAAVRRLNVLRARLALGLTGEDFRTGSITGADLRR